MFLRVAADVETCASAGVPGLFSSGAIRVPLKRGLLPSGDSRGAIDVRGASFSQYRVDHRHLVSAARGPADASGPENHPGG